MVARFSLIILVVLSVTSLAKTNYPLEDNQIWGSLQIEYGLNEKLDLELSEELRINENVSELSDLLTDIGAIYKFSDLFRAGIFYRFRLMPQDEEVQHEMYLNLYMNFKIKNLKASNRIRIHEKYRLEKKPIHLLRYQFGLSYPIINQLDIFVSSELFYRYFYDEGDRLSQGRYKAGLEYSISKSLGIEVYYMREIEYNNEKAINSDILGLDLKIDL
jgi:hypothetical protein